MQKIYNRNNYYRSTYAIFKQVSPQSLPFSTWHYQSKSGSSYYYTDKGVYRKSNHWGRAAKCRWVLDSDKGLYVSKGREYIGYANWIDFFENNDAAKMYFVCVDFENKKVTYDHKSRTNELVTFRSAKETKKIIQKVKRLLISDSWSKYYEYNDLEILRKELIEELIA